MKDSFIYFVAYKGGKEENLHAWFSENADTAGKEAADMIKDHGGVAAVVEVEAKELAKMFLKDWFKEEE